MAITLNECDDRQTGALGIVKRALRVSTGVALTCAATDTRAEVRMTLLSRWLLIALSAACLTACGPSDQRKAELAEKKRIDCLDRLCAGDVEPKYDTAKEVALKLNGQWFVGPREYFSTGINGASFEWWNHKALSSREKRPPELQALAVDGKGYDFSIEIFLRSNKFPPEPRGYKLIELAQAQSWIASRMTLRPGLDVIKMKHVIGPRGHYVDHVTYYVATGLKGTDGLPPVATCNHDHPDHSGGTGFMWQPGIWAGTRMNQRHCADWPDIYLETIRVLQLLRKA